MIHLCLLYVQTGSSSQARTGRQAPPLAYTPCQRFKASCASYADGSLRLLCAIVRVTDDAVRCQDWSLPRCASLDDVRNHSQGDIPKTPRSFQCRNLTEVSIFCSVLSHFRYRSVEFHIKSDRGVCFFAHF